MLNIPVICGSVRQGRRSILPAKYIANQLAGAGAISSVVDFTVLTLPFVDSNPNPSKLNKEYPYENVQTWSGIADGADGFIIVTPEYNHGYPGVLKNALDWLYSEFNNKPLGLVGVSDGQNGGLRAIEQLRSIAANFALYDLQSAVAIRNVQDVFDDQGNILDAKLAGQIANLIHLIIKTAEVMRPLRVKP